MLRFAHVLLCIVHNLQEQERSKNFLSKHSVIKGLAENAHSRHNIYPAQVASQFFWAILALVLESHSSALHKIHYRRGVSD